MSSGRIFAIVVPISVAVVIFIVGICCLCKRIRNKYDSESAIGISNVDSLQYDFRTIEAATNKFSTKIGKGGYGEVYKGTLTNGQEIAVKRLSKNSPQGVTELKNEVEVLAKVKHKNLVKLLGFCVQREEKILVYEYVTDKSLNRILFDPERKKELDWVKRYKIIKEIAHGIQYLHNDSRFSITHCNLKTNTILLDSDMNPKISDFSMALLFTFDQTQGNTRNIIGICDLMAPEYVIHWDSFVKSDVFNFGIILMEIISGKRDRSWIQEYSLSYTWRLWKKREALEILDPTIRESCNPSEVMRCNPHCSAVSSTRSRR